MAEHPSIDLAPGPVAGASRRAAAAALLLLAGGLAAPAEAASGWQKPFTIAVPTNTKEIFFDYPCPDTEPLAVNGAFAANDPGLDVDIHLGFNGPRIDKTPPDFSEWRWHFRWAVASKPGTRITFDAYCIAK